MYVLCVGMYRSGSTWQYDVACHLVEKHRAGRRLGFLTGEQFAARTGEPDGWQVVKSHNQHPAFAAALSEGRALALYSYRDLRDVAYSLAHKWGSSFAEVVERKQLLHLCLENDAFWSTRPRTLSQRYEAIMADPAAAVEEVAEQLGITLEDGEADAVAQEYSLKANLWRAIEFANRLRERGVDLDDPANAHRWDEHTQLHWNHIRAGRVGGWRQEAAPRELATLAGICGRWLIERGYEPDLAWALPALDHVGRELEATQQALREARAELARKTRECEELRQFGPLALGLARGVHNLSRRYPRLSAAVKRLLPGA
jgi:hypothetical protein